MMVRRIRKGSHSSSIESSRTRMKPSDHRHANEKRRRVRLSFAKPPSFFHHGIHLRPHIQMLSLALTNKEIIIKMEKQYNKPKKSLWHKVLLLKNKEHNHKNIRSFTQRRGKRSTFRQKRKRTTPFRKDRNSTKTSEKRPTKKTPHLNKETSYEFVIHYEVQYMF